ncbi:hypothetical protein EDD16DRAFT_1521533 [Pisolithus croceorrhizus]|nr:hypothetical protein EDD16DRAFT_1521533 [Pisolithus croceorrhizus]
MSHYYVPWHHALHLDYTAYPPLMACCLECPQLVRILLSGRTWVPRPVRGNAVVFDRPPYHGANGKNDACLAWRMNARPEGTVNSEGTPSQERRWLVKRNGWLLFFSILKGRAALVFNERDWTFPLSDQRVIPNNMGIPGGFGEDCSILITGLISSMLYGITTLQTYLYYMHYSEDSSPMKLLVAAIWTSVKRPHLKSGYLTPYTSRSIINYGVPAALDYIVWSYQVTVLMNCFFAHKIHYRMPYSTFPRDFTNWLSVYSRKVRWFVTVPIYYGVTPSVGTVVLAEILITVSLCVLLYDNGSRSAVPRTKRLVNSLITYAANRCLLNLIIAVAELGVNADQQAAWTMGLNFIIGKPSLNTRQYLRSRDSALEADEFDNAVRLANLSKHLEDGRSSKVVGGRSNVREVAVVCTTTTMTFSDPAFDNTPIL